MNDALTLLHALHSGDQTLRASFDGADVTEVPHGARTVLESFSKHTAMALIGARLTRLAPGEVDIELPWTPAITQQHGFLHGGLIGAVLDTACGFAALSLMAPDAGVLTVEYKLNFLAPGRGEKLCARARVRKPGRTLSLCEADAFMRRNGSDKLAATMSTTMMSITGRDDVRS